MTTPFLEKIYRLIGDFQRLWKFLLSNMQKLKIDPKGIEDVFISHLHWDHTGGLPSFLQMNNKVKLWVPSYFPEAKHAREVIEVKKPTKLYEGIYSTGELDGIEQSLCKDMIIQTGAKFVEVSAPRRISDYIYTTGELYGPPEEQSLIIDSKKGLVVITGCAHPGIVNIVKRAKELMKRDKVHLVLGGFHHPPLSCVKEFRKLQVEKVAPSHCTGELVREAFGKEYKKDFIEYGVGKKLEIK